MYRHCIFCSANLKSNDAVEEFPVGRMLAFDAEKGRLWAVCPRCRRWNLAPIEERWEAVESAERLFRGTRLRVHSENVGLAKLPDGTRLVRIGQAVSAEVASWRYGREFIKRQRWFEAETRISTVVFGTYTAASLYALAMGTGVALPVFGAYALWQSWTGIIKPNRPVTMLRPWESDLGQMVVLRRRHLGEACLVEPERGEWVALEINVPTRGRSLRVETAQSLRRMVRVDGPAAVRVLRRSMPHLNEAGAVDAQLRHAVTMLDSLGPDGLLRMLPARGTLMPHSRTGLEGRRTDDTLAPEHRLALEIAFTAEEERRALQGELPALEAAWREAEGIAAIADRLPDDLPDAQG
jgi:hypothetical protein